MLNPGNLHPTWAVGPVKLLAACLMLGLVGPLSADGAEIDFTRYLARHVNDPGEQGAFSGSFSAVPGNARLIATRLGGAPGARVELNGLHVLGPDGVGDAGHLEVPVTLLADNSIAVTLEGANAGSLSIRVKQAANIELHVESRVHFNTNVSSFVAAREFYGKLGFKTLSGFPDTNTLEMARAIGIETPTSYDGSLGEAAGGYLLHGELVGVGGFRGGLIDLIEFTVPKNVEPPYAGLNHLGMARAAMHTTNIAADYETMRAAGVEFLWAPTARSDGTLFAIFRDPDGTHYELIEVDVDGDGDDADVDDETATSHIVGLAQVNVNVSDFERSRAFYQMLGYEVTRKLAPTDSMEVAQAMGFTSAYTIEGAIVTNPADGSMLELVQWISPHDSERAYPIPVNHLGIHRMAFATSDIVADVATLKSQGVEFVSEITPCCSGPDSSGSIVAFYDPDGTVVELVEQPFMAELFSIMIWFRNTFF